MRDLYAAEDEGEFFAYRAIARRLRPRLEAYIGFLREKYAVRELPRAIVWTSREAAAELLSDIPVPAYTNEFRVIFCPDPAVWRDIWLSQLEGLRGPMAETVRAYYETPPGDSRLLAILGHELAHHSELFWEDFGDSRGDGVWFEEGMVEYIGRRYFLTAAGFAEEARMNRILVDLLWDRFGGGSLEDFGASTYTEGFAGIFFAYWRSFLAVSALVERFGSVEAVFQSYRQWGGQGSPQTLTDWFQIK